MRHLAGVNTLFYEMQQILTDLSFRRELCMRGRHHRGTAVQALGGDEECFFFWDLNFKCHSSPIFNSWLQKYGL